LVILSLHNKHLLFVELGEGFVYLLLWSAKQSRIQLELSEVRNLFTLVDLHYWQIESVQNKQSTLFGITFISYMHLLNNFIKSKLNFHNKINNDTPSKHLKFVLSEQEPKNKLI